MLFFAILAVCLLMGAALWRFAFYLPPFPFERRWHWTDRVANRIWRLPPQHQR